MAERRRQVSSSTTNAIEAASDTSLDQSYTCSLGDRIQLNGSFASINSGIYHWSMICPDGSDGFLTNPTMPGPSFVADQLGDYIIYLDTNHGIAKITVHVVAS